MVIMKTPRYGYLFFISKQTNAQSWGALLAFAEDWNKQSTPQLKLENYVGEDMFSIEFDQYNSPEKVDFDEKLNLLNKIHPIVSNRGIVDTRVNDDFIGSDFIQLGGQFYDEKKFYVNRKAFIDNRQCRKCGKYPLTNLEIKETPIVDCSFLHMEIEPNTNYTPSGVDFIETPGFGTIVTKKVKDLIDSSGAKGAKFLPLVEKHTKEISDSVFFLATEKNIIDLCPEHSPRVANAICTACGSINGEMYGYPYIPDKWLNGYEIFSRSPFGFSGIYYSKRLYELFIKENVRGIYVLHGMDSCHH